MRLFDIAVGNVRRRKAKSALGVLSLVLGVATVVALIASSQAMRLEIGTQLDEFGANVLIAPRTEQLTLSYGGIALPGVTVGTPEFSEDVLARIETIYDYESISAVSPKIVGQASAEGRAVLVVGVNFEAELRMKKWWNLDGLRPTGPGQAVLGGDLAELLGKRTGDSVAINDQTYTVAAVISQTGGPEDDLLFLHLAEAQTLLGREGTLTFIEVSALCNTCPIEDIVEQLSMAIPEARITALKQSVLVREETVQRFQVFSLALSVVVLLACGLSMLAMMLGSVSERTREIGIFRAIGYRRAHVSRIVVVEAALMSAAAGVLGYLTGQGFAVLVVSRFVQAVEKTPWQPLLLLVSVSVACLLGMSAAAYPAWRASRIDPAEALRHI